VYPHPGAYFKSWHFSKLDSYGWKVAAIADSLKVFESVLWLDTSQQLYEHVNDHILKHIVHDGYFFVGTAYYKYKKTEWTYSSILRFYNTSAHVFSGNDDFLVVPGAIGFHKNSLVTNHVLACWLKCALNLDCIAPPGSNKSNHRQDQTALQLCMYAPGFLKYPDPQDMSKRRKIKLHLSLRYWGWEDAHPFSLRKLYTCRSDQSCGPSYPYKALGLIICSSTSQSYEHLTRMFLSRGNISLHNDVLIRYAGTANNTVFDNIKTSIMVHNMPYDVILFVGELSVDHAKRLCQDYEKQIIVQVKNNTSEIDKEKLNRYGIETISTPSTQILKTLSAHILMRVQNKLKSTL